MKRFGNLYQGICSIDNLMLADDRASKGKSGQYGVKVHMSNRKANLEALHLMLKNKTYRTSSYTTFPIYEPKERIISRLPYFPDRIVHHAIMIPMEKIFMASFTSDTYSCIKGRGVSKAFKAIRSALRDVEGTRYCLKLDIRKFYPSINHDILKGLLRRKIKDRDLLWLMDEIIDSAQGVPIGNYLSQYFANFYLSGFDHWIKEKMGAKHYFRYADDIVVLSDSKEYLHELLSAIKEYLGTLKLEVKDNYQIFPVESRGIDFLGYVFFHKYTLLRKSIKQSFARMLAWRKSRPSITAYWGWAKPANTKHLLKKLLYDGSYKEFQGLGHKVA